MQPRRPRDVATYTSALTLTSALWWWKARAGDCEFEREGGSRVRDPGRNICCYILHRLSCVAITITPFARWKSCRLPSLCSQNGGTAPTRRETIGNVHSGEVGYGRRIGRGSISFSCPTTVVRSTGKRGSGVPFVHHDRLLSKLASHAFRYPPGHLGRSKAHSIALDEAHPGKLVSWRYVLSLPRYSTCKFC